MWKKDYTWLNINEDSKIVVALGDSFAEGQGAVSEKTWNKINWDINNYHQLIPRHLLEERKNSFVYQLCTKILGDWIPVNFGKRGNGNRSAVKQLHLHSQTNIKKAKEKIVIFMLSGFERFDFVNKELPENFSFFSMWPNPADPKCPNPKLWEIYAKELYSEKFIALEALMNILEAQTWCQAHNAKFILCSAFTTEVEKEYFQKILADTQYLPMIEDVLWDNFMPFGEYKTAGQYLAKLDTGDDTYTKEQRFYNYAYSHKRGTPGGMFTPCAHATPKGNYEIAKVISNYMVEKNFIDENELKSNLI